MPEGDGFVPVTLSSLVASLVIAILSPVSFAVFVACGVVDFTSMSLCFCRQVGQPFQRSQTRHEAIFASAYVNELRQAVKAAAHRDFGNRKSSIYLLIADDRILLRSLIYEIAIRHPLRLYEFK